MKNSKQVRKSDEQQKGAGGVSAVKAATTGVIMNPQKEELDKGQKTLRIIWATKIGILKNKVQGGG